MRKNRRKQPAKRGTEEKWLDKSKAILHFTDHFYNPLHFVVGRLLYVSGCTKFNRHNFEYKGEKEIALLVKISVLESGHCCSFSDVYTNILTYVRTSLLGEKMFYT
jgi:hypothetical protein